MAEPLLTPEELADYLKLTTERLSQWRSAGEGPAYQKFGRTVRYHMAEVNAWLQACRVVPGASR